MILEDRCDRTSWRPIVYRLPEHHDEISRLLESDPNLAIHDSIRTQLRALVDTRSPRAMLAGDALDRAVDEHLGGCPEREYGSWIHYPWSRQLIHLLPAAEYVELRLSRNRYKILPEDQTKLGAVKLGIAGLSVGHSTAITLALEGIGGEFRLADFDELCLSNMNRIRTGAPNIGLRKVVISARDLFAINPYLDVAIYPEGVNEENADEFLAELDLLFEETDDLFMKFFLREKAKQYRIPVLMETSDRGMIDVERYDIEPDRPLFHGLVSTTDARSLQGLDTYHKVPHVLEIIGARTMSRELAASLVEIDETIKTWPQLASAVALGGALNTDVARRVLLGQVTRSGRFYVDLEQLITDELGRDAVRSTIASAAPPPESLPSVHPAKGSTPDREEMRILVSHAILAPSGGNCQPWSFAVRDRTLLVMHDLERSRSFLDFESQAAHLAIGAACENLRLIAAEMGFDAELRPFPGADRKVVCQVVFSKGGSPSELSQSIALRCTNRRLGPRAPIDARQLAALTETAARAGARLQAIDDPGALDEIGRLLGRGDRLRMLHRVMHREMMDEVRWSPEEAMRRRDGLDVATLELSPTDLAGLHVMKDPARAQYLARIGGGAALEKLSRKTIGGASAVGLLSVPAVRAEDFFLAGRALQQVWLRATSMHLAVQPMTVLPYLFARVIRGGGAGLSAAQIAELWEIRKSYSQLFSIDEAEGEAMLFRIAKAAPPTARSQRRSADDVLVFD